MSAQLSLGYAYVGRLGDKKFYKSHTRVGEVRVTHSWEEDRRKSPKPHTLQSDDVQKWISNRFTRVSFSPVFLLVNNLTTGIELRREAEADGEQKFRRTRLYVHTCSQCTESSKYIRYLLYFLQSIFFLFLSFTPKKTVGFVACLFFSKDRICL